jgi:hypothetical protein
VPGGAYGVAAEQGQGPPHGISVGREVGRGGPAPGHSAERYGTLEGMLFARSLSSGLAGGACHQLTAESYSLLRYRVMETISFRNSFRARWRSM